MNQRIKRGLVLAAIFCSGLTAAAAPERIILISNSSRDLTEFRAFSKLASRLKPYGRVQIDIGVLAEKATFELPPGGNEWHQYAAFNANLSKFFPHPKLAPYLPAGWVAKNRELLLAKAAILRDYGLEAAMSSNDTHYLPEAFFERYPHLRGPRVDHPRRSRREEFTYCVDLPETLEMVESMTAEAKRNIPELKTILVHTNDSGTGLCWADNQYSGPNGPEHCRQRPTGLRLRGLAEAYHRGAIKAGGDIDVRIGGQFSRRELDDIARDLPEHTYLSGRDPLVVGGHGSSDRDPTAIGVSALTLETYPALGLIDPLDVLSRMEKYSDRGVRTLAIGTSLPWYYRADEPLETVARLLEVVEAAIPAPPKGLMPRLRKLHELGVRWGGERNADRVCEAFYLLDEAVRLKPGRYSSLYAGVSTRHITRPLLLRPEALSPADEAYFLPFIFNMSEAEARNDYADVHGGRIAPPDEAAYERFRTTALQAASLLEDMPGAPQQAWLRQMAVSIRMWACVMESVRDFAGAQRIRDARRKDLSGPPPATFKQSGSSGAPEYFRWYAIERREIDNTSELIRLLNGGGLRFFAHAARAEDEDTFLLGPDVVQALETKRRLMRKYWLDAQSYFTSPLI